jgi:phosphate transport system permease protein
VALRVETVRAGEPGIPARPHVVSRARTGRRLLLDRLAARTVVLGGIVIIASILAILFMIAGEVYPLFRAPTAALVGRVAGAGGPALPAGDVAGVDEYREIAYRITAAGLEYVPLRGDPASAPAPVPDLGAARISAVAAFGRAQHALGTSDGRLIPLEVKFDVTFPDGRRMVTPSAAYGEASVIDEQRRAVRRLAYAAAAGGPLSVAQVGPRELVVQTVIEKKVLIGPSRKEASVQPLALALEGDVTALALDGRGEDLFVGTARGQVVHVDMRDRASPRPGETVVVTPGGAPVTALGFLIGDRTLVVGDRAGGVSTWQMVPPPTGGDRRLTRIYPFAAHGSAVVAISASQRDKGFATADAQGHVHVHYGTSGQTLLRLRAEGGAALREVVFAPKADGVLALDAAGGLSHWQVHNPHPEITLRSVFGKVWYEGYSEPAYVWQSTGGTDDFEAKFSLTPLIFGTLKGTLYALLFAVPMALLAALYVSEFMHPNLKACVKPAVEIMAALPSVVLGFFAGLWLAPIVERIVPGLFLVPLVLPVAVLGALSLWQLVPRALRGRARAGSEALLLTPVVILGAWLAFWLGGLIEAGLLGGNYRGWLQSALGLTYDQRNSLVVGIAMGFAVIPIIFTIAEDSLANVPQHLRAGSLALGATRWQTALRVVLPTASPGIFSAVMIGFGRAVGETMIVLMATGNTPVMEWSVFNGFRALSANIAVELPEAPEGGTLFRVLFLAAFLLFCLTFLVNTLAELVRLKLRQRYRYL